MARMHVPGHVSLASPMLAGVDREAYYEEAIKLGGGAEALLGFVEGACKRGAPSAATYVAARRHAISLSAKHVTHLSHLNCHAM